MRDRRWDFRRVRIKMEEKSLENVLSPKKGNEKTINLRGLK